MPSSLGAPVLFDMVKRDMLIRSQDRICAIWRGSHPVGQEVFALRSGCSGSFATNELTCLIENSKRASGWVSGSNHSGNFDSARDTERPGQVA
jgi:hypothetical protein